MRIRKNINKRKFIYQIKSGKSFRSTCEDMGVSTTALYYRFSKDSEFLEQYKAACIESSILDLPADSRERILSNVI